jgi:hypothetical protein
MPKPLKLAHCNNILTFLPTFFSLAASDASRFISKNNTFSEPTQITVISLFVCAQNDYHNRPEASGVM